MSYGTLHHTYHIGNILIPYCCYNKIHKLSKLKQLKFVILHFWKKEIQNGLAELHYGGCGDEALSLCFMASRGHLHSLAHGPFLHYQPHNVTFSHFSLIMTPAVISSSLPLLLGSHHLHEPWTSYLYFIRTSVITLGSHGKSRRTSPPPGT